MGQIWVAGGWVFTHHIQKVELMMSQDHDEIMYMGPPSMEWYIDCIILYVGNCLYDKYDDEKV